MQYLLPLVRHYYSDSYTIVENLRSYLSEFNSSLPLFLGRQFYFGESIYMSGGAGMFSWSTTELSLICNVIFFLVGYVLTKDALRRFVELGHDQGLCQSHRLESKYEDVALG